MRAGYALTNRCIWVFALALCLMAVSAGQGRAREHTLPLSPGFSRIDITPYLSVFEDKSNQMTLPQIIKKSAGKDFAPLKKRSGFGYSTSGFWFRFKVVNPSSHPVDWVLEYPYAVADHVVFYIPGPGGYKEVVSGDRHPFDIRPVNFRTPAASLQTPPGTHVCYVKIASLGAVVAPMTGWSQKAFDRYRHVDTALNWLYYGIMLSTMMYCVFICFTLKDKAFGFLVVFVAGAVLFTLSHTGIGFQFFWPGHPTWANLCHPVSAFLAMAGGLHFSRLFLNTPFHSPFFDRLFAFLTVTCLVCIAAAAFIPYTILTQMSVLGIGIVVTVMLACGVTVLSTGVRPATFYLLAWSPFAVGALLIGFKSYGLIENNIVTDTLVQTTPMAVTFFFVFGLVDKVNTLQRDREVVLQRLNRSEEQFRMLSDNVKDVIWRLELPSFKITYITPSIRKIMGYSSEEAIRLFSFKEMLPKDDYEKVMNAIAGQMKKTDPGPEALKDFTIKIRAFHKNGSIFWTETSTTFVRDNQGKAVEMIGVTRDITDRITAEKTRKLLEHKLHQTGKLEAIGTLAGGIAHDMNNIMAAVLGYAELCFREADQGSKMHHRLGRIIKAAHRARDLVRQILAFSRKESAENRPMKFSLVLKEILALIRASLPATISIETHIRNPDLVVNADPTHLHQIVMNLCSNAGYAMKEAGGVIGIVLEKAVPSRTDPAGQGLSKGEYARLIVRDSGQGMDQEVLERIFDPFFTTKPVGQGTGLGLSTIHGIIRNMGGTIHASSSPGKGSEFQVLLPLAEDGEILSDDSDFLKPLPEGGGPRPPGDPVHRLHRGV